MDAWSFNALINELKKGGHSSTQVNTIRTTLVAAGSVWSTQVAEIIKLLSFDSSQLEVAKMAYKYAADKGAYASVVGSVLTFSSSKNALNKFIQNS